jgi:hypothetical protein
MAVRRQGVLRPPLLLARPCADEFNFLQIQRCRIQVLLLSPLLAIRALFRLQRLSSLALRRGWGLLQRSLAAAAIESNSDHCWMSVVSRSRSPLCGGPVLFG